MRINTYLLTHDAIEYECFIWMNSFIKKACCISIYMVWFCVKRIMRQHVHHLSKCKKRRHNTSLHLCFVVWCCSLYNISFQKAGLSSRKRNTGEVILQIPSSFISDMTVRGYYIRKISMLTSDLNYKNTSDVINVWLWIMFVAKNIVFVILWKRYMIGIWKLLAACRQTNVHLNDWKSTKLYSTMTYTSPAPSYIHA